VHTWALTVIAGGVAVALLYYGRALFITTAVALILALILEPLVGVGIRLRMPRSLATFVVCLLGTLAVYFAGLVAWTPLANLSSAAPALRENVAALVSRVTTRVQAVEDTVGHLVAPEVKQQAPPPPPQPAPPRARSGKQTAPPVLPSNPIALPSNPIQEVRIHEDGSALAGFVFARLGSVYEFVLMASFIPFLVFFMLSWRDHFYRSFLRFFDGPERIAAARSLEGIAEMARAFVVGNFLIGILLALLSWIAFTVIQVPYPLLAGASSGFLSLVPYVGVAAALVPPFVAILASGTSTSSLLVAALIVLAFHLTAMNVLYPKLVGARVHLNPLVVTVSLMFWGFLWDAPGLLLAIPLTAGIKAVCDSVSALRPYGRFLGD